MIQVDTDNLHADRVGTEGVSRRELDACDTDCRRVHQTLTNGSAGGPDAEYACLELPAAMGPLLPAVHDMAAALGHYAEVVVIGIGGSSLGAKAVYQAVARPARTDTPRLHFVENVDPCSLHNLLVGLDPRGTAVLCISKSGGTIETVAQYLILRDWLRRSLGPVAARRQQWIITDPQHGWLRDLASREDIPSLPVPSRVGGRYSVLSPVGLVPLAVVGVDVASLLRGAADNAARCRTPTLTENPALSVAALCYLLDVQHAKHISVMMPYVDRLELFVDWYRQLWAESLGKWDRDRPGTRPAGTLPVPAMGAIDQHSQLQMYLESRHDKFFCFLELESWEHPLPIPLDEGDVGQFPYLRGKSMADVIGAEFRATRAVVTRAGHPNMTIRLPRLDAHVLGQLIDLYQRATVYAGLLYGVNPLDQPSVETGKRLAIQYLREMRP
jgi:glucose-6-phosphate isomerase